MSNALSPGVYSNLSPSVYYTLPYLSASAVRRCNYNIRNLRASLSAKPIAKTQALRFGTAFHTYVLEPEEFKQDYVIIPRGVSLAMKEGKEVKRVAAEKNKEILKQDELDQIKAMKASLVSHPFIQSLQGEKKEVELSIISKFRGNMFKSRLDTYYPDLGISIDLKTTMDSSPDAWRKECRFGYIAQAAIYRQQLREYNLKMDHFYFAAGALQISVGIYEIGERELDAEWLRIDRLLQDYHDYASQGAEMPHYSAKPITFEWLPREEKAEGAEDAKVASLDAVRAIKRLNKLAGRNFKTDTYRPDLENRLKETSLESVLAVIKLKVRDWGHGDMARYLRPETLFRRSKFDSYLGEATANNASSVELTDEQVEDGWVIIDNVALPPFIGLDEADDSDPEAYKNRRDWVSKYGWAAEACGFPNSWKG